jgi:hypothetical protein
MTEEPASLIVDLLRQMRAELATKDGVQAMRAEVAGLRSGVGGVKSDIESLRAEVKSDMRTLRADVASDILSTREELSEQIVGLRRAVIEYHTSVIGRGILISELEARMRRVEHLNLPPLDAHWAPGGSRRGLAARRLSLRALFLDDFDRDHRALVEG